MKINSVVNKSTNISFPTFKAKEYAIAKTFVNGKTIPLNLFEINSLDTGFLDLMSSKIDFRKFDVFQNSTLSQLKQCKNMLNNSIMMVGFNSPQKSFLLTTEKKRPCGIITYNNFQDNCNLDYLISWAPENGKRIKYAGTTLLKVLYDDILKTNAKVISLTTAACTPGDLVKFYTQFGFKQPENLCKVINRNVGVDMVAFRKDLSVKAQELSKFVEIEEVQKPRTLNLRNILDINY